LLTFTVLPWMRCARHHAAPRTLAVRNILPLVACLSAAAAVPIIFRFPAHNSALSAYLWPRPEMSAVSEDASLSASFAGLSLADAPPPPADAPPSAAAAVRRSVVLVHEPHMQAHAPPSKNVFELPCRIVAIESVLRGRAFDDMLFADQRIRKTSHSKRQSPPPVPFATGTLPKLDMRGGGLAGEWSHSPKPLPRRRGVTSPDPLAGVEALLRAPLEKLLGDGAASLSAFCASGELLSWKPVEVEGDGGLWQACNAVLAPRATPRIVGLVHTEAHIREQVRRASCGAPVAPRCAPPPCCALPL
jgi:hypothetical protein